MAVCRDVLADGSGSFWPSQIADNVYKTAPGHLGGSVSPRDGDRLQVLRVAQSPANCRALPQHQQQSKSCRKPDSIGPM